jgi:radical SAM-linked protein
VSERALDRTRITFRKGEPLKYISHLDLLRAWERILRRAGVPLAYSQGFSPHPRITIAMPLPVGCTGGREEVDVLTTEPLCGEEMIALLEPALPTGIKVVSAAPVPLRAPARPALIRRADYEVALAGVSTAEVARRVEDLLTRDAVEVTFRRKTYDLRPLIASLRVRPAGEATTVGGTTTVVDMALLRDAGGRIGRPDVVLEALGLSAYARRIHRTRIVFGGE